MTKRQIIKRTADYIKNQFLKDNTAHDWAHIERVWKMAKAIAKKERANLFVVELGALLHDVSDWKFNKNKSARLGGTVSGQWLKKLGVDTPTIEKIKHVVENVSFKGHGVKDKMKTLEGKIVQDADRLDALGAIGVARLFIYNGYKHKPMYDPKIKPILHKNFKDYKKNLEAPSINHFYEKLLLLKDRMHTKTAKKIGADRHKFMLKYLNQFLKEWYQF